MRKRTPVSSGAARTAGDGGSDIWARDTAPQTPYTARQVGIGALVFAVGTIIAFGLPLALT